MVVYKCAGDTCVMKLKVSLRIVSVQLNSQIGQIDETLRRTTVLIDRLKQEVEGQKPPDLVVFPEFALTGYNFKNRSHILPYVCKAGEGPSFELAKRVSKLFGCYTVIGYPEKCEQKLYNSAIVTGPDGSVHFNYRKAFLYETDEQWGCEENPKGFEQFKMKFRARPIDQDSAELSPVDIDLNTSIGICMDLSPYRFEAPFQDMEFSSFNLEKGTELIICPMAWLHSRSITEHTDSEKITPKDIECLLSEQGLSIFGSQGQYQFDFDNRATTKPVSQDITDINRDHPAYSNLNEPDMSNINYWLLRFLPFLSLDVRRNWFQSFADQLLPLKNSYMGMTPKHPWGFAGKNAALVIANRCGVEDCKTIFAGSSGIFKFNGSEDKDNNTDSTNQSVKLFGNLGKGYEGLLMRDIDLMIDR